MRASAALALLALAPRGTLAGPGGCEFFAGEEDFAPFSFWRRAPNGSIVPVQPESDESGLCVFPAASCGGGDRRFACCSMSPDEDAAARSARRLNLYLCLGVVLIPAVLYRLSFLVGIRRPSEASLVVNGPVSEGGFLAAWHPCLATLALYAAVTADVVLMVTTARATQGLLDVPTRNAMLAAGALLEPIREIFQFLEDSVTVQINFALGAKATRTARLVLHIGVAGGLLLGAMAACLLTGLSYWTLAVEFLIAPFSRGIAADCPLVPDAADVVETARPYVLLMAWKWPFQFVNMVLRGFLLGTNRLLSLAVLVLLEQGITLTGVLKVFPRNPTLEVLGWTNFIGSAASTLFMVGVLLCDSEIRREYVWDGKASAASAAESGPHEEESDDVRGGAVERVHSEMASAVVLRHGLLAMVLDLAVQLPLTLGVYVAGVHFGIGAMYQISSLQAAFPQYGIQWISGLVLSFRVYGTKLVGAGLYPEFRDLFVAVLIFGSLLAVVSVATVTPFRTQLSFDLARQACEYASDRRCLPIYASIFGGGYGDHATLQGPSILVFVPALAAVCFFKLFKAGLYACLDWCFMAKAGCIVFVAAFLPAVALSVVGPLESPAAVLAAMYLPQLALTVAFAARLAWNIREMFAKAQALKALAQACTVGSASSSSETETAESES